MPPKHSDPEELERELARVRKEMAKLQTKHTKDVSMLENMLEKERKGKGGGKPVVPVGQGRVKALAKQYSEMAATAHTTVVKRRYHRSKPAAGKTEEEAAEEDDSTDEEYVAGDSAMVEDDGDQLVDTAPQQPESEEEEEYVVEDDDDEEGMEIEDEDDEYVVEDDEEDDGVVVAEDEDNSEDEDEFIVEEDDNGEEEEEEVNIDYDEDDEEEGVTLLPEETDPVEPSPPRDKKPSPERKMKKKTSSAALEMPTQPESPKKKKTAQPPKSVLPVDSPKKGGQGIVEKDSSTIGATQVYYKSHELPNNSYLRICFRVTKGAKKGHLIQKKRLWEVDCFRRVITNIDEDVGSTMILASSKMYRVEKHPDNCLRLSVYFFEREPAHLELQTNDLRQRLFQLLVMLRARSITWSPTLCQGKTDVTVNVDGSTISTPSGKSQTVNGVNKFVCATLPYELLDVWTGCINMRGRPLPGTWNYAFSQWMPKGKYLLYAISFTMIPDGLMHNKGIQQFLESYFGPNYFCLLNTIRTSRPDTLNSGIVVFIRRTLAVTSGNVEGAEVGEVKKAGVIQGVGATLRYNETTMCFLQVSNTIADSSPVVRAEAIKKVMGMMKLGDPQVDFSMRFDYLFVMGAFGFSGAHEQDNDQMRLLIDSKELFTHASEPKPTAEGAELPTQLRIVIYQRPATCRFDVKAYSCCDSMLHVPATGLGGTMFTQRTYLGVFQKLPETKSTITITGVRITGFKGPSFLDSPLLRVTGEFVRTVEAPMHYPKDSIENALCVDDQALPPLYPADQHEEYIRLQCLVFSILCPAADPKRRKKNKKDVIGTFVLPLKHHLTFDGSPATVKGQLIKLSGVVADIECTLTLKTEPRKGK